jgi:hypothetical protein
MKDRKNLEQQLADKLGNRSIAPDGQAWERIAHNRQLGKNKKKKTRVVLYYAASVILLLLFGSYFFMAENSETIIEPQVVNVDKTEDASDVNTTVVMPETVVQSGQTEVITSDGVEKNTVLPDVYKAEAVMVSGPYKDIQLKESLPVVSVTVLQDKKALTKEQLYEEEVDYLLKNAIKEVAADKLLAKPTSDTALLKEVELEMDEYYREKAMSIFSLKNKKIRFAVKDKQ